MSRNLADPGSCREAAKARASARSITAQALARSAGQTWPLCMPSRGRGTASLAVLASGGPDPMPDRNPPHHPESLLIGGVR